MQVTRWRRYGKDRLYIRDDRDVQIGWWDLVAEEAHLTDPAAEALLFQAVAEWKKEHAPTSDLARPAAVTSATRVETPPRDLAWNAPGEQLRPHVEAAHLAGQRPTMWRRFWLGKRAYSSWERGAIGENLVAAELRKLPPALGWGFLHSIPVGDGTVDIDHLVIGPGGVFTVNAKHHSGARIWVGGDTVMVNGVRHPYVRNSRHEAQRVARMLTKAVGYPVRVTGLLVPVNAGDFTVKAQPDDVYVVNRQRLVKYLLSRPTVLAPADVVTLFSHARMSSPWGTSSG